MLKDCCSNCFHSLGVPSRMKIYMHLQNTAKATVSELVEVVALKQPTVSYHLKEMEENGLVTSKKSGKEVYYQVAKGCTNCVLKHEE
jgi:DNA-binding transcriptional ArsR family regulator